MLLGWRGSVSGNVLLGIVSWLATSAAVVVASILSVGEVVD